MNAILFDSALSVKSESFGRGIPAARRPFVPSIEDLNEAAQMFGDLESDRLREEAENRRFEEQALEFEWNAQFEGAFPPDVCQMCGEPADWLDPIHGLCAECDDRATNATMAGQNHRAGLGYRVF
jgi:hypothetical protein